MWKSLLFFNRIDEKELAKKIEEEDREPEPVVEKTPEITIDDFAKIELKVGEVIECHKHPKADKLLVEKVRLNEYNFFYEVSRKRREKMSLYKRWTEMVVDYVKTKGEKAMAKVMFTKM